MLFARVLRCIISGPQQHGPRRMRNLGVPRLGDVCPFLELPPEIRNRIYEYALGGQNLHIFALDYFSQSRPDWRVTPYYLNSSELQTREPFYFQYSICKCPGGDADAYETSLASRDDRSAYRESRRANPDLPLKSFIVHPYLRRHADCLQISQWFHRKTPFRERPVRLSMALLRTCKQVYNEACLVPYYDNTFSFSSGKDIDVFVNAVLQPKQRDVLQHLQYALDNPRYRSEGLAYGFQLSTEKKYVDCRILDGLRPSTIKLLVGLQSLDVSLEDHDHRRGLHELVPRFVKEDLRIRVVVVDDVGFDVRDRTAGKLELEFSKPAPE
jgi:hypothetical protein